MASSLVITEDIPIILTSRIIVLSGSVKNSLAEPLSRQILVYKRGDNTTVQGSTYSSPVDGTFSVSINAGPNDMLRIIALADENNSTENSKVFDKVHG